MTTGDSPLMRFDRRRLILELKADLDRIPFLAISIQYYYNPTTIFTLCCIKLFL